MHWNIRHKLFHLLTDHRKLLTGLVVIIGITGLWALANSPAGRVALSEREVRIVQDLPYVQGTKNDKQKLDLYLPRNATNFPMVVFVHGGFWRSGDRLYYPLVTGLYQNIGVALAKRGIGVAIPSYRLQPYVRIEDQLGDTKAAVDWTREHAKAFGGDAERLFLMGHSAGGHIVMLLSAKDGVVANGVIALSPVTDLKDMAEKSDGVFNREVTHPFFGSSDEDLAHWSPVTYAKPGLPPMLMLSGERDFDFIPEQTLATTARYRSEGNDVTASVIPDLTHAQMTLSINGHDDIITPIITRFIASH